MTKSDQRRRSFRFRPSAAAIALVGGAAASTAFFALRPAHSQDPTATVAPATATTGTDWTIPEGGSTRTGVADANIAPPLSLLWRYTAGRQNSNPCAPIIVGTSVFFAARGDDALGAGALYALNTQNGSQLWRYNLTKTTLFRTAPTYDNGIIYIGASDGNVYAINATTGEEIVRYHTTRPINSAPIVLNGVLYFGSDDGTLYALEPQGGTSVWHRPYKAGDAINSTPVITNDMIFITTDGNDVQAVKLATGQLRWSNRLPYRIPANAPIYADNTLYVPAGPRLYALQPASGSVRWARDAASDIMCTPVDLDGVVYIISRDIKGDGAIINAVRSANGKDYWAKAATIPIAPAAAPTISGNVMYIPTVRNLVIAVSLDDGHILWQYKVDGSTNKAKGTAPTSVSLTAPVSLANGGLYVLSDDGALSAFRKDAPDDSGPALFRMYPSSGQRVNGEPPLTLASYVDDTGSGVDPASIKMTLDDKSVDAKYDSYRSLVSYQTRSTGKIIDEPLHNGRHSASIVIADWRGNVTTQTWSFIVDSSVARYTKTDTPEGDNGKGNGNSAGGGKRGGGGGRLGGPGGPGGRE